MISMSGRSPDVGNVNLLQYFCLENSTKERNLAGCSPWGCKESDTTKHACVLDVLLKIITSKIIIQSYSKLISKHISFILETIKYTHCHVCLYLYSKESFK